jgi:hypothetical protein
VTVTFFGAAVNYGLEKRELSRSGGDDCDNRVKSGGAEYTGYAKPSATICLFYFVLLCVPCVL